MPRAPGLSLRLYVAGNAPNSVRALANVRAVCAEHYPDAHTLDIIDVLVTPGRALADGVLVTPTLVKVLPLPVQRVVGSLGDTRQLLLLLGDGGPHE